MTASESNALLALHSCSTSSFNLEQKSDHQVQPTVFHIGNGSEFWPESDTPSSTVIWTSAKALALTDVTICYVSDLQPHGRSTFMNPRSVEEIHFDGHISQKSFDRLVLPLTNLKLLEIHISSLEHLNLTRRMGYMNYLPLPNLESLQISSYHFTANHATNLNIDKIVNNCCILLRKNFPSLNFLAISLPLVRHREDQITESILKSLKTHKRTLKSLNVESTFEIEFAHIDPYSLPIIPNLDLELTSLKDTQLHSFHYFTRHKTHCTTFWRKFLQTQRKLEYLQFWCIKKYYPLPTVLVLHCFRNLHTIALNINPSTGSLQGVRRNSIDCTVFRHCSLLRTIVLKGKPKVKDSQLKQSTVHRKSDLENFGLIPKGLEHIRLIHLGLNTTDARLIAREMPNLSALYLENIGEEHSLGLAVEDLAYLLEKKSLLTLDVHSGINKGSYNDISNESSGGFGIVAKILFKTHNPQSFTAVLGANGEYDIVNDSVYDEDEGLHEEEIFHENQPQFENSIIEDREVGNSELQFFDEEESFENSNFNQYNQPESARQRIEKDQPRQISTFNKSRQNVMKRPNHNYPTIPEEPELSGSSSDEEILDVSPPRSSTRLRDAQTETDIDIFQTKYFRY